MRKLFSAVALSLLLATAGCDSIQQAIHDDTPRLAQEPTPPRRAYYETVGEEVPPDVVLGTTYNRGEIKPTTKWGQISTGVQWFWSVISNFK